MRAILTALILATGVLIAVPAGAEAPIKVVASFSILADLVAAVGGDRVAVTALVGPDSDTHVYEPTPADARALGAAALVVTNGLGLDGWIDRLIAATGYRGARVIASAGIAAATEHGTGRTDPHAWQDLRNGIRYAATIEAGLSGVDPAHADHYARSGAAYQAELTKLDAWVRAEIGSVPESKRKVITTHDAFGYFGRAYGVQFLAPLGLSTESEASAAEVGQLIRQIRREKITALFIETMTDPRLLNQIARETTARPGGALYSDALSAKDGPAPTYLAMFRHNVTKLKAAMLSN